MQLLIVRHAIAVERTEAREDALRPLTDKGKKRMRRGVRGLAALDLGVDHVWHSPWLRAVQTAKLLEPICAGDLVETPLLAAEPGDRLLAALARDAGAEQRIAVVGHEPWMGELLALLVTGSPRDGENLVFKKGGVALVAGDPTPRGMELLAVYPPRTLRALAV